MNNPVIMLDEVDKLGRDFHNDPHRHYSRSWTLRRTHTFRDHYLDLPFDLSKVFFITTANTLETLSQLVCWIGWRSSGQRIQRTGKARDRVTLSLAETVEGGRAPG